MVSERLFLLLKNTNIFLDDLPEGVQVLPGTLVTGCLQDESTKQIKLKLNNRDEVISPLVLYIS